MRKLTFIFSIISSLFLIHCSKTSEQKYESGIGLSYIDTTINPGDDFFNYTNGAWVKTVEIPASQRETSAFYEVMNQSLYDQRTILEDLLKKNSPKGSLEQKIADFYALGMDSTRRNQEGTQPLQSILNKIDRLQSKQELNKMMAYLHRIGCNTFWGIDVEQDLKKSDQMILCMFQNGIGMPDRDYYVKTDLKTQTVQQEYKKYIKNILHFFNSDSVHIKNQVEVIYEIEKKLAKASMTKEELRDYEAQYNKFTLEKLNQLASIINWNNYFQEIGLKNINNIIVAQPLFIKEVNQILNSGSLEELKIYLKWTVINSYSDVLSDSILVEHFTFFDKNLKGLKEIQPRWKRSLKLVNVFMGEGFGKIYVEKHFSIDSKKKVNELVDDLLEVCKEHIESISWMNDSTKKQALFKLKTIGRKLGFPDKWQDYSKLQIDKNKSYVENIFNAVEFLVQKNLDELDKPVDKTKWGITPQTVNAYYELSLNEIVFPAAFLQPPFFFPKGDAAVNYGTMVASNIGHEIIHAFDDTGSQFDAYGNMIDWWTKKDRIEFKDRIKKLAIQYDNFIVDSLHVNGNLVLGEAIADLGGLIIGYKAFERALKLGKIDTAKIDGFTPEQRFFIGYAQTFRSKLRPEFQRFMILNDVHPPDAARVNISIANMPEFYKAFNVKPGDKMYIEDKDRVKIW